MKKSVPIIAPLLWLLSILFLSTVQGQDTAGSTNVDTIIQKKAHPFPGTGVRHDVADPSIIPTRSLPQHTEFMNGTSNYPATPRNQWELGIKTGLVTISGDVTTRPGFGYGLHIRKALGYLFSARLSYMEGTGKGLNWQPSGGYRLNQAWADRYYNQRPFVFVFYNYKTKMRDLALEGTFTLNNIRFHKAKTGWNLYALGGIGMLAYDAQVNALNDQGNAITDPFNPALKYDFARIGAGTYKKRNTIKKALRAMLDDTYETGAEMQGARRPAFGSSTLRPVGHLGLGIALRLNHTFNLALEDRMTITKDDLLDGQQWAEQGYESPTMTRDADSYNYLTLGLNMNLGNKATEPLWWSTLR